MPTPGKRVASATEAAARPYRGRLAPSPTGLLHLGHAKTFWWAYKRAVDAGGTLVMRSDDLDFGRSKPEYAEAFLEDLAWFGIRWKEGPDVGGPNGPYSQSERIDQYRAAFEALRDKGVLFPCTCSRKDILAALSAPHQGTEEPIYPGTCHGNICDKQGNVISREQQQQQQQDQMSEPADAATAAEQRSSREAASGQRVVGEEEFRHTGKQQKQPPQQQQHITWRFRVPDGEEITFVDGHFGPQALIAGKVRKPLPATSRHFLTA